VDISEIKKAQEQLDKAYRYFKTIFDTSSEMFIVCGPDGKVRDVNRAAEFLFGYSKEEILDPGFDWRCCVHPEDLPFILDALETVQKDNVCRRLEVRGIKKDGSEIFLLASYTPIEAFEESSGGRLILLGIYVDITETKRLEAHLRYLSFHDSLTELFNRAYFEQELDRLSKGRRAPVGVIIVDLDNLKPVNDTLGHAEGDALLKRAARALREAFRAEDVIARLGGDEFGVILVDADKKALEGSIERLQKAIDQGKENGSTPKLSISAGYAIAEKTPFEPGSFSGGGPGDVPKQGHQKTRAYKRASITARFGMKPKGVHKVQEGWRAISTEFVATIWTLACFNAPVLVVYPIIRWSKI